MTVSERFSFSDSVQGDDPLRSPISYMYSLPCFVLRNTLSFNMYTYLG